MLLTFVLLMNNVIIIFFLVQASVPVTRIVTEYTVDEMCELLTSLSLEDYEDIFRRSKIDGERLIWHEGLKDHLKRLGIYDDADAELLENKINVLKNAGF